MSCRYFFPGCGLLIHFLSGGGLVAQWYLTLYNAMDCSPPGSSVHGSLQARILEWVAISFSRGSSQPRDRTWVSCIAGGLLHHRRILYRLSFQGSSKFSWWFTILVIRSFSFWWNLIYNFFVLWYCFLFSVKNNLLHQVMEIFFLPAGLWFKSVNHP